jgi:hypothetical protein
VIEERDVARVIKEAFAEFSAQIDQHASEWQDDPMIYILVGSLFQWVADIPEGPTRISAAKRMYALTDKMLENGSEQVQDCFSIEMIEPLVSPSSAAHYPNFEPALGIHGKRDLAAKREWLVQYSAMNELVNDLNGKFGSPVFERVGIGNGTMRVIANPALWKAISEAHRDSVFADIQEKWSDLTGHKDGIEITEPAENGFRVLRQS